MGNRLPSSKLFAFKMSNKDDINIRERNKEEIEDEELEEIEESLTKEELKILGPKSDTQCSFGPIRHPVLENLATPFGFVVLSSLAALIQGIFFTYTNASLSTVQKHFAFSSSISGLITTGNDIIQLVLSIPLPFIASRRHRPRFLAGGMALATLGCFVAVIPYLLYPPLLQIMGENSDSLHHADNATVQFQQQNNITRSDCVVEDVTIKQATDDESYVVSFNSNTTPQYIVIILFIIAQMLCGVASLLYYTIGFSYMDESVHKHKAPMLLAIAGGMRLLGPICGYALASFCLRKWLHPHQAPPLGLKPRSPHWIGAWWLGYVIIGVLLAFVSWPLVLLPKSLLSTRKRRLKEVAMARIKGGEELQLLLKEARPAKSNGWRELFSSLYRLKKNSIFLLVLCNQGLFWFSFFGYITFKSKYIEHQFRLSAAQANKYIAGVSISAALVGWLGTGFALTTFTPRPRTVVLLMALLTAMSMGCHLIQMCISCDHRKLYGFGENLQDGHFKFNTNCTSDCLCARQKFNPTCVNSTWDVINPCFGNCWQQSEYHTTVSNPVAGFCPSQCSSFSMYLWIAVVAKMSHAASRVPVNLLLLRCVEERDKDVALGIFNAFMALTAFIPAPILFGWAIDKCCIMWQRSSLRTAEVSTADIRSQLCWLYDLDDFRRMVHGLPAGVLFLCLITDILLLRKHKKLYLYDLTTAQRP